MKKAKQLIFIALLAIALLPLGTVRQTQAASAKEKIICVTNIKGNKLYYYNCRLQGEVPYCKGKKKKATLSKSVRFYCYDTSDYDANTLPKRCSKNKFKKRIKRAKSYNGEGFYVQGYFKNGKCVKLYEPYWP